MEFADDIQQRLLLVQIMAFDLMEKHGVSYMEFKFSNSKDALGWCSYSHITVQKEHAIFDSIDDVENTLCKKSTKLNEKSRGVKINY